MSEEKEIIVIPVPKPRDPIAKDLLTPKYRQRRQRPKKGKGAKRKRQRDADRKELQQDVVPAEEA